MTSRSKTASILGTTILVSAGVLGRLISSDPILARDDQNILSHLHGISGLFFLLKRGRLSELIAYQPVRDFSYFFDLSIQKYLGWSSFHFTNFAIWVAIILSVYLLLKTLYKDRVLALEMTVLFAFHPIFVDSVGWISARKHLLSCLFIFLATYLVIGFQEKGTSKWLRTAGVFVFYCLSILSQPINVLWPVWVVTYYFCFPREQRRKGLLPMSLACVPVLIAGGIANLYYYIHLYPQHTAALRWANAAGETGIPFLSLGRYFFNLLLPIRLALIYYPGSMENIVGLILGCIFVAYLTWKIKFRSWFPWFVFFLFPLLPVIAKPTNIFVSDTYILVGSFGALNLLILSVGSIWKRSRVISVALLFGLLFLSFRQAKDWESDRALWTSSYASEPAPKSLAFNAKYLLEDGRYTEAMQEALLLEYWDKDEEEFPLLFAKSVYLNPEMDDDRKIALLEKRKGTAPWIDYFLASLYAKQKRFSEAFALMQPTFDKTEVFSQDLPVIAAETRYFCLKADSPKMDCDIVIDKARKSGTWDEKRYFARLDELTTR